ncbi:unnamed protein product [Rotaria sordida]|uniref:Receptor ligand binding region domain-containing protein n=1 Tax=Rotaria sordida TaxID=392033 RepID=A0A819UBW0_9BILA|nr:unnamed protein product [Rotaria sordida]CAF4094545.1 unnamed protein product [Rotaria sordida]
MMRICILLLLLWAIPSDRDVKRLDLFPEYNYQSLYQDSFGMSQSHATDVWSQQSQVMFLAAISLANQYNIKLNNQTISGDIIETNNDENEHVALNRVCHYISTQRSNIVVIVGSATSNNARFISPFAAHIKLPVVSYSATNAEFSDTRRYPKFYQIVPSDFFLARTIVQLFKRFNWTTCTIIIQKNDYGYSGLNILSE